MVDRNLPPLTAEKEWPPSPLKLGAGSGVGGRVAESREIGIDWVAAWPRVRRELLSHLSARVQPATLAEDLCQDVDRVIELRPMFSARDVAVILTTDSPPPAGAAERNRLNVQRHRARRRLLALLEAGAATVAAFVLFFRRHLHVPVVPAAIVVVPVLAFSLHAIEVRPRPHAADVAAATHSEPGRQLSSAVTLPTERPVRAPAASDRGTSGTPIVSVRPTGDVGPGVELYEPDHPVMLCFDNLPVVDSGCVDRPNTRPDPLPHP